MADRWAGVLRFIGIGWYIATCIILGTLGGRWLGQKLDGRATEVTFTLLGLGLGLGVAFVGLYRMLREFTRNDQDKDKGNN